jgi:hypothetical protein
MRRQSLRTFCAADIDPLFRSGGPGLCVPPYQSRSIPHSEVCLHYFTGQPRYVSMGQTFLNALVKYCRVDAGYTRLNSVVTKEKDDQQDRLLLAEDFKYYYLLFSPEPVLDLSRVVFNTEAHPLPKLR